MRRDVFSLPLDLGSELIADNFAGGGGASTGIEAAFGRPVDIAVNHDFEAIAMHAANHPRTKHYCESVFDVDPVEITGNQPVGLVWLSPDCKHFSKAKGGKPVSKKIRGLAWIALRWASTVKPRVIMLENVEEFVTWGPLGPDGRPCPKRKGSTFRSFVNALARQGYRVDWRELRACDFGAPTIRKRLFLVARCDGLPITWPTPTHGDPKSEAVRAGKLQPWRTAADCIDWSIPCPSIFERERPLKDATLRRIARGIMKFVVNSADPFIVSYYSDDERFRGAPLDVPLGTTTTANRFAVVAPTLMHVTHHGADRTASVDAPIATVTGAHRGEQALVSATLIQTGYGEREGQEPRVPGLDKPLGTAVAGGVKHAVVAAFIAKHYGGVIGTGVAVPIGTVTTSDHHSIVTATLEMTNEGNRGDSYCAAAGTDHAERQGRVLADSDVGPIRNDHAENAEAGGVQAEARLLGVESMHGRPAVLDAGSSCGLGVDEGSDTGGIGAQSRGRKQAQQRAVESGTGNAQQESRARVCDGTEKAADSADRQRFIDACEVTARATDDIRSNRESDGSFPDDSISSRAARVRAFLIKFYSQGGQWQDPRDPMHTIPTKDRIGLVTIHGEDYAIVDIGMRMLTPRELARAQGFPDSYVLDPVVNGKRLSKSAQVRMIGNSVCPDVAEALVRANFAHERQISGVAA